VESKKAVHLAYQIGLQAGVHKGFDGLNDERGFLRVIEPININKK